MRTTGIADRAVSKPCSRVCIVSWAVVEDHFDWGMTSEDWWDSLNVDARDMYLFAHGYAYKEAVRCVVPCCHKAQFKSFDSYILILNYSAFSCMTLRRLLEK